MTRLATTSIRSTSCRAASSTWSAPFPVFETQTEQYALFAEDRLTLSKELSLVAGIRLDHPTIERDGAQRQRRQPSPNFEKGFSDVTWRAGRRLHADPRPGLLRPVRDGCRHGRRPHHPEQPQHRRSSLRPAGKIEIGVKQSFWDGRGEWTLAAYDIEKNNLLSPRPRHGFADHAAGRAAVVARCRGVAWRCS